MHAHSPASIRLMMALTPKRLFLSLCISIFLLRPYTFFSRSPLVFKTLFVTVFHTSVDLLCKKSYKSSSLHRYFNCFLSNHTVGCWNINFSCLSQIRMEKSCFLSNVSLFLLYFLRDCSCFDATFGQLFTLRPQFFCFSLTLYTHSLLKNEFFSDVHG